MNDHKVLCIVCTLLLAGCGKANDNNGSLYGSDKVAPIESVSQAEDPSSEDKLTPDTASDSAAEIDPYLPVVYDGKLRVIYDHNIVTDADYAFTDQGILQAEPISEDAVEGYSLIGWHFVPDTNNGKTTIYINRTENGEVKGAAFEIEVIGGSIRRFRELESEPFDLDNMISNVED
ncbi:MAG: hypothetical protein IJ737_02680 [Ruminococcus sp.]|nr:hypothetical protein [Ruminococcus sp.]